MLAYCGVIANMRNRPYVRPLTTSTTVAPNEMFLLLLARAPIYKPSVHLPSGLPPPGPRNLVTRIDPETPVGGTSSRFRVCSPRSIFKAKLGVWAGM